MFQLNAFSRKSYLVKRFAAVLLAFVLVAAGCSSDSTDGESAPPSTQGSGDGGTETEAPEPDDELTPVSGGTVVMGLEADTNSWLPGEATLASSGLTVAYAIYDPLMKRSAGGTVEPYLAESLTPNDDLTAWTLKLRPGVTFHDGTPLDSSAIKTIFDEYLTSESSNLRTTLSNVEGVEVVDDLTAVYNLLETDASFPDLLTGASGWPFSPTAAAAAGDDAGSNPVGTGPFVFESWRRDDALKVVKNDKYWREGLPYLDAIEFRVIVDDESRRASLEAGDSNMIHTGRNPLVAQLRTLDGVTTYEALGNSGSNFLVNTDKAPVDDVRVRRALAHAMDQDVLIELFGGKGLVGPRTQYFDMDSPWFSEKVAQVYPNFDADAARVLIDEYVNDPSRSDGRAVGSPVELKLNHTQSPGVLERAQGLQAMFEDVGVKLTLEGSDQAPHISLVVEGNFQIASWRTGGEGDPYPTLRSAFSNPETTNTNYTRFWTPELAELIDGLRTTEEFTERYEIMEKIGVILAEDIPNLWAGGIIYSIAAYDNIHGIADWTLPSGELGDGTPLATVMWAEVWQDQ